MAKIKIILFGGITLFHCAAHVAAIITDEKRNNHQYLIDYPFPSFDETQARAWSEDQGIKLYDRAKNTCWTKVVTLYSDEDCEIIIKKFIEKFEYTPEKRNEFSWTTNNCATAVNYILDQFFSNETCLNLSYQIYQTLCFIGCIGTLGLQICPAPPCINTPADVFRKAKLLHKFGGYDKHHEKTDQDIISEEIGIPLALQMTNVMETGDNPVEMLERKFRFIPGP